MKILLLIILSIALGFSSSQNADDVEIQKTLDLLDEGQRHIELNEHRDVVLILGNTGSEKSTFLQWILGDNSKLIAVEVEEGKFIIQDGNVRIGSSNIESKTLIPELVMDNSTNSAYYDCPGFSDTRSTSHEVATTYFIKRVADHAQRIKLVFIVGHSSVSEGNDKLDFMKLLTHATELVRDVDKFGNSVALVATKVISIFKGIRNGKAEFTSDASVINDVGKFLLKTKEDLVNDHSKAKFVQLLDSFLLKNRDNSYARIGIFRRPMIAGPLSENEDLLKAKEHIVEILNNLRFRVKNAEDFGYTVSDRSKNEIANFIHAIGITVENHLDKLVKTALGEFEKSVLKVESQLEAFESEDSSKVKANEEIEKLESVLNLGLKTISKLANDVKAVNNPRQLVEIIRSAFSHLQWLDVSAISDTLKVIDKQGDYFNFFQVVSKQTFLISNSWAAKWQKAAEEMTNLKSSFKRFISSFVDKVGDEVGHLLYQVERVSYDYHKAAFDGMKERITIYLNNVNESLYFYEISKMKRDFEESVKATSSLIEYVKNENDLTRLNEKFVESVGEIFVKEKISTKMKRLLYFLNSLNIDGKMRKSWAEVLGKKVRKMSDLNRNFDAFVNSASDLTNSVINSTIANLTRMTRDYFENIGERVHGEVNSYVKGSISSSNPFRVQKLVNKLSEGHSAISKLSADSVNAKHALELTEKIANFSSSLHLKFLYPQVTNVAFQLRNLALLLEIQEKAFVMPVEWLRTLRDASDALRRLENSYRTDIFGLTINFKKTIGGLMNDVGQSIERYYEKIVDEMEYKLELLVNGERLDRNEGRIFRDNFMLGIDSVSALVKYIKALTNATTLAEEISQSASEMRVKLSADLVENIESKCVYLNYLLIVSDETFDVGDSRLAGPLEETFRRLSGVRDKFKQSSSILISAEESNIETSIANFSQCLHEYYREKLNRVKTETKYFTQNSPSREADVSKARELCYD